MHISKYIGHKNACISRGHKISKSKSHTSVEGKTETGQKRRKEGRRTGSRTSQRRRKERWWQKGRQEEGWQEET